MTNRSWDKDKVHKIIRAGQQLSYERATAERYTQNKRKERYDTEPPTAGQLAAIANIEANTGDKFEGHTLGEAAKFIYAHHNKKKFLKPF